MNIEFILMKINIFIGSIHAEQLYLNFLSIFHLAKALKSCCKIEK